MAVYNGQDTLFWQDVWIGDKPLLKMALHEIPTSDWFTKVHNYWIRGRGWNWEALNGALPPCIERPCCSPRKVGYGKFGCDVLESNPKWSIFGTLSL